MFPYTPFFVFASVSVNNAYKGYNIFMVIFPLKSLQCLRIQMELISKTKEHKMELNRIRNESLKQ